MSERTPPCDLHAEAAVLGAILVSPGVLDQVSPFLADYDFYRRQHQVAYRAMLRLRALGQPIDLVSVAAEADATDVLHGTVTVDELFDIQASLGSIGGAVRHARTVVDHALRRQAIGVASDIASAAYENADVDALIALANGRVSDLIRPVPDQPPADLSDLTAFLTRPKQEIPGGEWAIPGVLRRTWRAVFVGGEGSGKSTLLRQLAVLPARGLHPFVFTAIPKIRTLMVDCENPSEVVEHQVSLVLPKLHELEPGQCWLWSRPQGIDVRARSSRAELEAAIAHVRPALVCMGPIYKMFRTASGENYEAAAAEVQNVLDDLRMRYQFALVLEAHQPGASGADNKRAPRPGGSALWLRWSEFGVTLKVKEVEHGKVQVLDVGRFRYDRIPATWPTQLVRGMDWPWEGRYPDGTFTRNEEPF